MCCTQELGIPFTVASASEKNPHFQAFLRANYEVGHLFDTMEEQVKGGCCSLHTGDVEGCGILPGPQYLVMGTPCNPYSPQRAKRYHDGSVKAHGLHDLTFRTAYEMLTKYQPVTATMEQSFGFGLPEEQGSKTTPLDRPEVFGFPLI